MKLALAVIAATPLCIGFLSSLLLPSAAFSDNHNRVTSKLQPPGWVFSVAWSILYVLLGVSGALTWAAGKSAFGVWAALTAAILAWYPVFALVDAPFAAFVSVLGIFVLCLGTIWKMGWRTLPAWLLVPLAAWLAFASYLASVPAFNRSIHPGRSIPPRQRV